MPRGGGLWGPGVREQRSLCPRGCDPAGASPQATCALYEVLSAPASGTAVLELYPQLLVALLLRVSCTVGVQLPRNLQVRERRDTGTAPARSLEPCR